MTELNNMLDPYAWMKRGLQPENTSKTTSKDVDNLISWGKEIEALQDGYLTFLRDLTGYDIVVDWWIEEDTLHISDWNGYVKSYEWRGESSYHVP